MKELNAFREFINESKLFEALNKDLKQFGPDLEKKLKGLGLAPSILSNDKKNMALDAIEKDPKKVAIVLSSYTNPLTSFELIWNSASEKIVMKAVDNFQTQTGQMSSKVFQKSGWDEDPKYTKNLNPGDIFKTKVEAYPGDLKAISYYRVPPNRSESLGETKENVDELFGRREDPIEKQASMVFNTIEFVDDLVSAGHVDKAFFDVFTEKMAEAYSSLMMGASPELQNKMGFEVDVDLEENDVALDEVIKKEVE